MQNYLLKTKDIEAFKIYLYREERSELTIEKYIRDVFRFQQYLGEENTVCKEKVITYKNYLNGYFKTTSANSMLAALNSFFAFMEWNECRIKQFKVQRDIFCSQKKELSKEEYIRLVKTAKEQKNDRLGMIMETICATGIRISELKYITAEAVQKGVAQVDCKGKNRVIFIVKSLQKKLLAYCKNLNIVSGCIFITRSGAPVNRSNVWAEMKQLCQMARIDRGKVFPHNLRHLFARIYYGLEKDLVRLADILGHSSIETTRVYTISSGQEHQKQMERMRLII